MAEKTVLCVDDELFILNALKRVVLDEDYTFITANSGAEGLAILETTPVHLVISDQRMPEMTGIQFLQQVKERHPETVRIILSGYADLGTVLEAINSAEIFRFMAKPWNDDELILTIRQCLAHYDYLQDHKRVIEQYVSQNQQLSNLNNELAVLVTEHKNALQLTKKLFQKVPIPLIGINKTGQIDLVSHAIRQAPASFQKLTPGTNIHEVFPTEMVQCINQCMKNETDDPNIPTLLWNDNHTQIRVIALRENGDANGCLIVLEEL